MKIILIIIAVGVGMIQTVARAAEEPPWSLEGRMISADSCGADCHCIIGGPPDNGLCKFFAISQVDNGQYGDVKLDGVKYGIAGEFALKIIGEPIKHSFVAYYIDSGASAEQKEALRKLFTGPSFAGMGQPAEVKEVAIKFENLDAFGRVGKTASGTVGEIATAFITEKKFLCRFTFGGNDRRLETTIGRNLSPPRAHGRVRPERVQER